MNHLETLIAQVQRYAALTERPETDFSSISRALAELNAPTAGVASSSLASETQSALEQLMVACVNVEPVWALQAGVRLWASGRQQPHDFSNLWNCARYAGIQSRFSAFTAEQHLQHLATLYGTDLVHAENPAPFIIRGALLHKPNLRRHAPNPRRIYPTATVTGRPSWLKRLSSAARMCSSTT